MRMKLKTCPSHYSCHRSLRASYLKVSALGGSASAEAALTVAAATRACLAISAQFDAPSLERVCHLQETDTIRNDRTQKRSLIEKKARARARARAQLLSPTVVS